MIGERRRWRINMRMKGKVLLVLICALAVALLYSANALQSSSENSNSGARSQGISMVKLVEIIQSPPVGKLIISGDEFTITYVVENVGTAAAPDFAFKIPDLPQGVRMVKEPRPQTIPPGERAEFTFVFQAVAEGEYELTAQAFDKGDFIGKESLLEQKAKGLERKLVGFEMIEPGIARHGYSVVDENMNEIGLVTSGTFSPYLKKSIGMAYLPINLTAVDTEFYINIRDKKRKAKVVALPFYSRKRKTSIN